MNQDFPCYNSSSLDQYQPPKYLVVHQPSEEKRITEIIEEHYKGVQTMMLKMFEIHRQKQAEQRKEEKRSAEEQAAQVSPQYWKPPICYDDDEECSIQMRDYYKNSPIAIASDSPITDSLITEDEHLDTIPEMESDEVIKSSIKDLDQTPKSGLIESFRNKDTMITSTKIDFLLEEFAGKLALINPIPSRITETSFDPKKDIRLIKNDSLMEEIDIFLVTDDSIPPGIDSDGYDSEEDNLFLEYDPDLGELTRVVVEDIFGEPRVHMPNVLPTHPTICQDLDFTLSTDFSGFDIVVSFPSGNRNKTFDLGISIEVQSKRFLSLNKFSISFISDPLSPVLETLLPFSSEIEDKVFNPGILVSKEEKSPHLLSHRGFKAFKIIRNFLNESPMMIYGGDMPVLDDSPNYEDSRARGNGYQQKDKNKAKTGQNRARDWKERGKPKPKAYAS
ncbi:hypothetical protein Tco_0976875 [Tanacetum coccineum]|uniref:Uncharacterized protein n=1 Tax=Tanacetum coccineum TaxID=301880 RepID=A0ABQ5EIJ9_9ASTR